MELWSGMLNVPHEKIDPVRLGLRDTRTPEEILQSHEVRVREILERQGFSGEELEKRVADELKLFSSDQVYFRPDRDIGNRPTNPQ